MKIRTIGFGYVKNLRGYENCKAYMEAELEPWEDTHQTFDLLRTKVAEELGLHGEWFGLRERVARERRNLEAASAALQAVQDKLSKTEQKWKEFTDSLTAHGIDSKLIRERINVNNEPPHRSNFVYQDYYENALTQWVVSLLQQPAPPAEESTSSETPFVGNEYDVVFDSEDENATEKWGASDDWYSEHDEEDDCREPTYIVADNDTVTPFF